MDKVTCRTCRDHNRCPEWSRNYPCWRYRPNWQEFNATVKPQYPTEEKVDFIKSG